MGEKKKQTIIDNADETLCLGRFNVGIEGPLATLTFTHDRHVYVAGQAEIETIVKARIVTSTSNLIELRDVISNLLEQIAHAQSSPAKGGTLN